jgi:hypothetical protein
VQIDVDVGCVEERAARDMARLCRRAITDSSRFNWRLGTSNRPRLSFVALKSFQESPPTSSRVDRCAAGAPTRLAKAVVGTRLSTITAAKAATMPVDRSFG